MEGGTPGDKGWTRHTVSANVSRYALADFYWPAFRTAITEADAKGVMCSCTFCGSECVREVVCLFARSLDSAAVHNTLLATPPVPTSRHTPTTLCLQYRLSPPHHHHTHQSPADNAVNMVPTCADPLMRQAREDWNFTGYVTSDSDAVGAKRKRVKCGLPVRRTLRRL